ncbi:MAG: methylated-DNA-[protein]-cysteine S-methyltransferase [Thermomicrobiales bacterium]|nr:methylated-DNA-[protein]-cysteine S-methyltransferase [Thermomicrobiales bacterium]
MTTLTGPTPIDRSTPLRRRRAAKATAAPPPKPSPTVDLEGAAKRPGTDPCDIACEAMPGFVVGDLNQRDTGWLLDHTQSCKCCRDNLGQYERLDEMLDRLNRFVTDDLPTPPPFALPSIRRAGYGRIDSPIGPLFIAASDAGVCEIGFGSSETEATFQHHLQERGFRPVPDWNAVAGVARQLREYFGGERDRFEVPLDFSGVSPFTRSVLTATAEVPYGRLSTYRHIAQQVGRPSATRAVGNALGRNPIPVIVPCHRIVRSDASLGGYTGGLEIKERLLSLEGVYLK